MKEFKTFMEEAPTQGVASVPGAGSDSDTVIVRKKYDRKNRRDDMAKLLKRFSETWGMKQRREMQKHI